LLVDSGLYTSLNMGLFNGLARNANAKEKDFLRHFANQNHILSSSHQPTT
jgi:hypothetical protein